MRERRCARPSRVGVREVAIAFPEDHALSDEHLETLPCKLMARALVEGAELGGDGLGHLSERSQGPVGADAFGDRQRDGEVDAGMRFRQGFDEGLIVAAAQNFTRSLVNEPGNVLTPTELGRRAAAMCAEVGLKCEVHSTAKLHELKMGAFWAVAQGSDEPPALIVMTYEPELAKGETAAKVLRCWGWWGKGLRSIRVASRSSPPTAWRR